MTLISVIIPTYNRERYVIKAIDSVLNQTFTDYEIIVVDDGSTDDTCQALERYSSKIRYIYQENSGVSSARNSGIKVARGEWIAFLDSDDEWRGEYLANHMTQVQKYPHAVAHTANAAKIWPDGKRSNHFAECNFLNRFKDKRCLLFERPLRVILDHQLWLIQASIIRKDILFEAGLFDTQLSMAEDLDLIARVALRGAFTFCRKELVKVIRRDEAMEGLVAKSLKSGVNYYRTFGMVFERLLNSGEVGWSERATLAKKMSNNWQVLGNVFVIAGKEVEARQFFKRSFLCHPSARSLIKFLTTFLPEAISRSFVRKPPVTSHGNATQRVVDDKGTKGDG